MAVIDISEEWSSERATQDQTPGVFNSEGMAVRTWTVLAAAADGADVILAAAGLPALGDAHPDFASYTCRHLRPGRLGPTLWRVEAEYGGVTSPLLAPYKRLWSSQNVTEAFNRDAAGNLIDNVVGDPYVNITREIADMVYQVTRNEATFPEATARTYVNSISTDAYHTYAIGECYMRSISGEYVPLTGATFYWRVTYEMVFRVGGWDVRVVNKGPRFRPGAGLDPVAAKDRFNVDEVKLAADGTKLAEGAADVWRTFTLYSANNFTALALG